MKNIFTLILILFVSATNAQVGVSSLGFRFGGVTGLSYKYIGENFNGFELIAGGKEGGFQLTGLIQKSKPIASLKTAGFFVFIGGGAHAGYTKQTIETAIVIDGIWYYSSYNDYNPVIGGDFILGAEYHFESIPLHLSLDYKPYFELFGEKDFRLDLWDIGFTIKYAFNG